MGFIEAQSLINARGSTVWEIITDAGNFPVWDSGITEARGELRNRGTIRLRTGEGGSRSIRFRVEQIPGEVMTWQEPAGVARGLQTHLCPDARDAMDPRDRQ